MLGMRRICVHCGSSSAVSDGYLELARRTGQAIAERGLTLVYGGGGTGLMGEVASGALEAGGKAIGVTIKMFDTPELGRPNLTQLHVLETMHERKAKMVELADGFVALPGGLGTLDELIESLAWAQLGIHAKPVGLINHNGYFDPLLSMLEQARREGFLFAEHAEMLLSAQDPGELIERLESFRPDIDLADRWITQVGEKSDAESG